MSTALIQTAAKELLNWFDVVSREKSKARLQHATDINALYALVTSTGAVKWIPNLMPEPDTLDDKMLWICTCALEVEADILTADVAARILAHFVTAEYRARHYH